MNKTISKSTFLLGWQCEKALYLQIFEPDLRDAPDENAQFIMDMGTEVGSAARQLFPGGVDCTPSQYYLYYQSIQKAKRLLSNPGDITLYEAYFRYQNLVAGIDILRREGDAIHIYEVKSTTSLKKDVHIPDAAFQYYLMKKAGYQPATVSLVYLNKEYVREGDLDIQSLFVIEDITESVLHLQNEVEEKVGKFQDTVQHKLLPDVPIGPQCDNPYICPFHSTCWQDIPEYSVFDLYRGGKKSWDLYNNYNILHIKDIPDDYPLSPAQEIQVLTEKLGEPVICKENIQRFLQQVEYPVYHLDFEAILPPIPLFDKSRPFQPIAFQYSLHIQPSPGAEAVHKEFLASPGKGDPRLQLMPQLMQDLPATGGTVVVYHASFEKRILSDIAMDFPQYDKYCNSVVDRITDLETPFAAKDVYYREMRGKSSLKSVLPALVPELSYEDLDIQEGNTASRIFYLMFTNNYTGDYNHAREKLLEYCKMDTLAMVKILDKLHELAQ